MSVMQNIAAARDNKETVKSIIDELIAEMLYLSADIVSPTSPKMDPAEIVSKALRYGADLLTILNEGVFAVQGARR